MHGRFGFSDPHSASALSQEKEGLQVTLSESTLDRDDLRQGPRVDVSMAVKTLKTTVRNLTMKPIPAGTAQYTILVRRLDEERGLWRSSGTVDIPELGGGRESTKNIGSYELRSVRHRANTAADELAGWQLVFKIGDKPVTFESSPQFTALLQAAEACPTDPARLKKQERKAAAQ